MSDEVAKLRALLDEAVAERARYIQERDEARARITAAIAALKNATDGTTYWGCICDALAALDAEGGT